MKDNQIFNQEIIIFFDNFYRSDKGIEIEHFKKMALVI